MAQPNTSFTRRTDASAEAEERSISELLQQLTEQTTRLAQKEIELAKAEMAVKGKRLGIGAGAFSAAGLLALFALGARPRRRSSGWRPPSRAGSPPLIVAVVYLCSPGCWRWSAAPRSRRRRRRYPSRPWKASRKTSRQTKEKAKEGRA